MNEQILEEILNQVKENNNKVANLDKKIDEKINKIEDRITNLENKIYGLEKKQNKIEERLNNIHSEIIQEYNIFIDYISSFEQKNNKEHQNLINEINESKNNLYRYKNTVTQGIDVLKKIVG